MNLGFTYTKNTLQVAYNQSYTDEKYFISMFFIELYIFQSIIFV